MLHFWQIPCLWDVEQSSCWYYADITARIYGPRRGPPTNKKSITKYKIKCDWRQVESTYNKTHNTRNTREHEGCAGSRFVLARLQLKTTLTAKSFQDINHWKCRKTWWELESHRHMLCSDFSFEIVEPKVQHWGSASKHKGAKLTKVVCSLRHLPDASVSADTAAVWIACSSPKQIWSLRVVAQVLKRMWENPAHGWGR